MSTLYNLARMTSATVGTGTITLGAAVSGYLTFALAGVPDGAQVTYGIKDGSNSEVGFGTYTAAGTTLARNTILASTNSNAAISLSGNEEVYISAIAEIMPDTVGQIEWWANNSVVKQSRVKANGQSLSRSAPFDQLFAYLVKSSTVTITIASPGVVTWNNHGLNANDPVKFFTTGALPTGLTAGTHGLVTAGTVYYVVGSSITTNTFQVSTTPGGAAVNTSGTQSGTQTAVVAPHGDGDGSTTFTVPDLRGVFLRSWDDGAGIDSNRSFGSKQTDAMQGHKHGDSNSAVVSGGGGPEGTSSANQVRFVITGSVGVSTPTTDGTNGTPRTAAETRPTNYALMATIRYR